MAKPLAGDFNFETEHEQAEKSFSACGGSERHPLADQTYLIHEAGHSSGRAGQLVPIMEDEHGTYIMNSKDLRAVEYVERLTQMGVDSLKIEGRTKSRYYVARTAQIYRRAIDDAVAGQPFNPALITELDGLANRGYTAGFLERRPSQDYQNYETGHSLNQRSQFVGEVCEVRADGWALVEAKNQFAVGNILEIIHPSGNRNITLAHMQNEKGQAIALAPGNPHRVWVDLQGRADGALIAKML
jgi:putative protease